MSPDPTEHPQVETPLFAGCILGVRAWEVRLALPFSATRLVSSYAGSPWEPGREWTTARCTRGGDHTSPDHDCSCGMYAWHASPASGMKLTGSPIEPDPGDEPLTIHGVIEAAGRVEVHRDGFRAERARPVALVAGRHWAEETRRAIEDVARLYGVEVLEVEKARDLYAWCEERGGALGPRRVRSLLAEVPPPEPEPKPSPPVTPPRGPGVSSTRPKEPLLDRIAEKLIVVVLAAIGICMYGAAAVFAVFVFGAIFLGWADTPPPKPLSAKVAEVVIDRDGCRAGARVVSKRPVKKGGVVFAGRLADGEGLGHDNRPSKGWPRGASTHWSELPPKLCASDETFRIRARIEQRGRLGAPAVAESTPPGVRKAPRPATPST